MPTIILHGVSVEFPFEPYDCQRVYMSKVIEILQTKGFNGLLESPTGTGKTLCLLCATLAWVNSDVKYANTRIVYSSRTHSQLAQVLAELKRTSYKPTVSLLGSREQLCVHPEIKNKVGMVQNNACKTLVSASACMYHRNTAEFAAQYPDISLEQLSLSELSLIGIESKICPYYLTKETEKNAQLILLPYNYVLDAKIREGGTLAMGMENSIVIFDEAHNIESVAMDALSFSFSVADLASCIRELDICIQIALKPGFVNSYEIDVEDLTKLKVVLLNLETAIDNIGIEDTKVSSGKSTAPSSSSKFVIPEHGLPFGGKKIYEIFEEVNIKYETRDLVMPLISAAVDILSTDSKSENKKYFLPELNGILRTMFKNGYTPEILSNHYRTVLHNTKGKKDGFSNQLCDIRTISWYCFNAGLAMKDVMDLNIRNLILTSGTLSPLDSFAFELQTPFHVRLENPHIVDSSQVWIGVLKKGPSSQVLNSSFSNRSNASYISDLGNSVINFCRIIPDGVLVFFPSYTTLQECLDSWGWKEFEINNKKLNTCDDNLENTDESKFKKQKINSWKNSDDPTRNLVQLSAFTSGNSSKNLSSESMLNRLSKIKNIVIEPRSSSQLSSILADFKNGLDDTSKSGSVLFAVMRGKVAEGLDFSDRNGRGVIITGLPYPNVKEMRVQLKREYLDTYKFFSLEDSYCSSSVSQNQIDRTKKELALVIPSLFPSNSTTLALTLDTDDQINRDKKDRSSSSTLALVNDVKNIKKKVLQNSPITGNQWYSQQASRAVNQAVGRVIRHRYDFGAILLADERFASNSTVSTLSSWLRPMVQTFEEFGASTKSLGLFFKRNSERAIDWNKNILDANSSGLSVFRQRYFGLGGLKIPENVPEKKLNVNESNFNNDYQNMVSKLRNENTEKLNSKKVIADNKAPSQLTNKQSDFVKILESLKAIFSKESFLEFKSVLLALNNIKKSLAFEATADSIVIAEKTCVSAIDLLLTIDSLELFEKIEWCNRISSLLPSSLQTIFIKQLDKKSEVISSKLSNSLIKKPIDQPQMAKRFTVPKPKLFVPSK